MLKRCEKKILLSWRLLELPTRVNVLVRILQRQFERIRRNDNMYGEIHSRAANIFTSFFPKSFRTPIPCRTFCVYLLGNLILDESL